ncbi:MAG: hypothetical protein IKQ46_12805 [Bacteroidales bacterium]|nr:hypothetical protein [Bacteroidales bacterium]
MEFSRDHNCMLKLSKEVCETQGKKLMFFNGVFGRVPFAMIDAYCEDILDQPAIVNKKVRTVFVELAQNINFYSEQRENNKGIGFISVCQTADGFMITSANTASKYNESRLSQRLENIKLLDKSGMHSYKRKLMHENFQNTETANIGVVQSSIIAEAKFRYDSVKIEDNLYFITLKIEIKVPKLEIN